MRRLPKTLREIMERHQRRFPGGVMPLFVGDVEDGTPILSFGDHRYAPLISPDPTDGSEMIVLPTYGHKKAPGSQWGYLTGSEKYPVIIGDPDRYIRSDVTGYYGVIPEGSHRVVLDDDTSGSVFTKKLFEILPPLRDTVVVRTASGNKQIHLHVYDIDLYNFPKVMSFRLDGRELFAIRSAGSGVMLPGSSAMGKDGEIGPYSLDYEGSRGLVSVSGHALVSAISEIVSQHPSLTLPNSFKRLLKRLNVGAPTEGSPVESVRLEEPVKGYKRARPYQEKVGRIKFEDMGKERRLEVRVPLLLNDRMEKPLPMCSPLTNGEVGFKRRDLEVAVVLGLFDQYIETHKTHTSEHEFDMDAVVEAISRQILKSQVNLLGYDREKGKHKAKVILKRQIVKVVKRAEEIGLIGVDIKDLGDGRKARILRKINLRKAVNKATGAPQRRIQYITVPMFRGERLENLWNRTLTAMFLLAAERLHTSISTDTFQTVADVIGLRGTERLSKALKAEGVDQRYRKVVYEVDKPSSGRPRGRGEEKTTETRRSVIRYEFLPSEKDFSNTHLVTAPEPPIEDGKKEGVKASNTFTPYYNQNSIRKSVADRCSERLQLASSVGSPSDAKFLPRHQQDLLKAPLLTFKTRIYVSGSRSMRWGSDSERIVTFDYEPDPQLVKTITTQYGDTVQDEQTNSAEPMYSTSGPRTRIRTKYRIHTSTPSTTLTHHTSTPFVGGADTHPIQRTNGDIPSTRSSNRGYRGSRNRNKRG